MNEELAVRNLKAVKEVFDKFGIKFWLLYGTVLGAVRDGKILEWDHDVDLGIFIQDRDLLFLALDELGKKYKLTFISEMLPSNHIVQFRIYSSDSSKNHQVDVFMWTAKGDKYVNPTRIYKTGLIIGFLRVVRHYLHSTLSFTVWERPFLQKNPSILIVDGLAYFLPLLPVKVKSFLFKVMQRWDLGRVDWVFFMPKKYFEKFETIEFYGLEFNIPNNPEDFLRYNYGENWKIPQKKWDWVNDNKAQNWVKK